MKAAHGFDRDRVPDWGDYADRHGIPLRGKGTWLTGPCLVHGGSDSMRVNSKSGGWVCMSCGAHGGDTLAHYQQITGVDFVTAARDLGAWVEGGTGPQHVRRLSARDALTVIGMELGVCVVVIADARKGVTPNADDWARFLDAVGRVQFIAREATA